MIEVKPSFKVICRIAFFPFLNHQSQLTHKTTLTHYVKTTFICILFVSEIPSKNKLNRYKYRCELASYFLLLICCSVLKLTSQAEVAAAATQKYDFQFAILILKNVFSKVNRYSSCSCLKALNINIFPLPLHAHMHTHTKIDM